MIADMKLKGVNGAGLDTGKFEFSPDVESVRRVDGGGLVVKSTKKKPHAIYVGDLKVHGRMYIRYLWWFLPVSGLVLLFLFLCAKVMAGVADDSFSQFACCLRGEFAYLEERHVAAFDFLRVIALVLVVFAHVLCWCDCAFLPIRWRISSTCWGALGVSMFMVLSGAALSISSFGNVGKAGGYLSFCRKRFKAILPPFFVAYIAWLLFSFAVDGSMAMGGDWRKIVQTLFGMDGYFHSYGHSNYYLLGEWYLGCILMLYLIAPLVYRLVRARPVVAIASFYGLSMMAVKFTSAICEWLPIWNWQPQFNVIPHLFEFAFGIAFFTFIRPRFKLYSFLALGAFVYVASYVSLSRPPLFFCTWTGFVASASVFTVLCYVFDMIFVADDHIRGAMAFLGKLTFLAFLHHHLLLFWLVDKGSVLDGRKLAYTMALVIVGSYALAYVSLKPAKALAQLIFPDRSSSDGSSS